MLTPPGISPRERIRVLTTHLHCMVSNPGAEGSPGKLSELPAPLVNGRPTGRSWPCIDWCEVWAPLEKSRTRASPAVFQICTSWSDCRSPAWMAWAYCSFMPMLTDRRASVRAMTSDRCLRVRCRYRSVIFSTWAGFRASLALMARCTVPSKRRSRSWRCRALLSRFSRAAR